MTEIKVGDRVRNVETKEEVTVAMALAGYFLCADRGIWRDPQGYEPVQPAKTKLIPFQADKWTPDMQVVTQSGSPVRILCVDAGCGGYPVLGLVNNEKVQHWDCEGKERNESRGPFGNLWFVVDQKTKTLYGYWNECEKYGTVYESESERDRVVEHHAKDHIYEHIKFQTEIEL